MKNKKAFLCFCLLLFSFMLIKTVFADPIVDETGDKTGIPVDQPWYKEVAIDVQNSGEMIVFFTTIAIIIESAIILFLLRNKVNKPLPVFFTIAIINVITVPLASISAIILHSIWYGVFFPVVSIKIWGRMPAFIIIITEFFVVFAEYYFYKWRFGKLKNANVLSESIPNHTIFNLTVLANVVSFIAGFIIQALL